MGEAYNLRIGMPLGSMCNTTSAPAFATAFTLDAATDALEFLVQSETTDAITHVGVRWASVGATPGTYTIGIEGVTGTPLDPDGTYRGATNNAKLSFTPSGTGMKWYALGESFTPTRGELFFITLKPDALPTNASTVSHSASNLQYQTSIPRVTENNAGSRTRLRTAFGYGYKTASRVYGRPIDSFSTVTIASDTTPDEAGVWFNIPTTFCASYKVAGVRIIGATPVASKVVTLNLYTGADADPDPVTATIDIDGDAFDGAAGSRTFELYFDDATLTTLTAGTAYRITLAPGTSTDDMSIYRFNQVAGEDENWEAWGGGTWFKYTSRADAGSFAEDADQRPAIELIIVDVTAPTAGGGGPLVGPGRLIR